MKSIFIFLKIKYIFMMFIMFLLVSQNNLFAQTQYHFGIKGGINFSNFSGKDAEGDENTPPFETKKGITVGIFTETPINNIFSFQSALLYSVKGAKNTEEEQGESVTATFNLNYIEIPILAKIYFPLKQTFAIYAFTGPELGIKIKSNFNVDVNGEKVKEKNMDSNTKSLDFGLLFGAGIALNLGKGKVFIEGGYDLGLLKMYKEENGEPLDMKNKVISIMGGVIF